MARADKAILIAASILVIVAVFNLATASGISSGISSKAGNAALESAEATRPANISVVSIVAKNCADCFDISGEISKLKSAPVSIVSERSIDFTSAEAKQLIQKYSITKVPALVITGEVKKQNAKRSLYEIGGDVDGAIIFSNPLPVYVDVLSGNEVGRVSATIILAESCKQCSNMSLIVPALKTNGIVVSSEKTYAYDSSEGNALLKKYNITKVPAMIFSKDLAAYPVMTKDWERIGTIEKDGSYVMGAVSPPYLDISTNSVRGLVSVTYLSDSSCPECYNVSLHKRVLSSYGVSLSSEQTYDAGAPEGKALISKYNITQVPTIVLSSEASVYPQLSPVWKQVGSVEKDGTYVFRSVEVMGTYKDLIANKIIAPSESSTAQ